MTHVYPIDGARTSIKLREDVPEHAGHCSYCAATLSQLSRVVVILDGAGPLCRSCSRYSPLGAFASGLRAHLVCDDAVDVIVACWRRIAYDDFVNNRAQYGPELQAALELREKRSTELKAAMAGREQSKANGFCEPPPFIIPEIEI